MDLLQIKSPMSQILKNSIDRVIIGKIILTTNILTSCTTFLINIEVSFPLKNSYFLNR